ncbi:MAG TPA: L-aspartate oxidase [Bryobacteraceae bacterium]|nr:L-aspartate oxidase [Bryobacteraceae bacterium]
MQGQCDNKAIGNVSQPETLRCDFLVVGAGVAGLRAAIELAEAGTVLVVAKDTLRESSSEYAQGGIAVALSDDDEVSLHEQDTLNAGAGLCDPKAVRVLVEEGPAAIEQLIQWGVAFDRDGSELLFAREGAHSRNRVLHAHGDSTGREIARVLYATAASLPNISFRSFSAVTDLLLSDGHVVGAAACDDSLQTEVRLHARATLLATGGLGAVYSKTTNPGVATGDGVAAAFRAGATVSDLEFVQFHPTALSVEGKPTFLLTEALRGEGARLLNLRGERFMTRYHEMGELAPRDVVSRSIVAEMTRTGAPVTLDLTHLGAEFVQTRFPRVYSTCLQYGVDITAQPVPVSPAAHYAMGGVLTDLHGRADIPGLYAAGEAACTGVHGANRLASNSLLEGVVYGGRAGAAMVASTQLSPSGAPHIPEPVRFPGIDIAEVRRIAWESCGIARSAEGLEQACARLTAAVSDESRTCGRRGHELRNIHTVVSLIARSALAREESRGGHYRVDFPEPSPAFCKHSRVRKGSERVVFCA